MSSVTMNSVASHALLLGVVGLLTMWIVYKVTKLQTYQMSRTFPYLLSNI